MGIVAMSSDKDDLRKEKLKQLKDRIKNNINNYKSSGNRIAVTPTYSQEVLDALDLIDKLLTCGCMCDHCEIMANAWTKINGNNRP